MLVAVEDAAGRSGDERDLCVTGLHLVEVEIVLARRPGIRWVDLNDVGVDGGKIVFGFCRQRSRIWPGAVRPVAVNVERVAGQADAAGQRIQRDVVAEHIGDRVVRDQIAQPVGIRPVEDVLLRFQIDVAGQRDDVVDI